MNSKQLVLTIAFTILLASCSNNTTEVVIKGDFENGILITNEGAFSGGTGTINFISKDLSVQQSKIYQQVNGENLGTIVQSAGFNEDEIYVIANIGNKISIANRYTMEKTGEIITNLNNPRYIAFANNKAYVTNWGDGFDISDDYVAVIDLSTFLVIKTIPVIEGPEQIIENNGKLYISHKGGFGSGNSVTVIDSALDTNIKNISVGDIPDEIFINSNGNIVVSCEGKAITQFNTTEVLGSIVTINSTTDVVDTTINLPSGVHPNVLLLNEGKIYFSSANQIFSMDENATTIPTTPLITTNVSAMSVNDGKIYVTDKKDFQSDGSLTVLDANTNTELQTFTVGLIPGKIYFN